MKNVALITGGNRGLGLETARQLGAIGLTVVLGSRELGKGEAAARRLKEQGIDARAVKLDVTSEDDARTAAEWIEREFGRLDVLVNNAGIMHRSSGGNHTSGTSQAELQETFETNFNLRPTGSSNRRRHADAGASARKGTRTVSTSTRPA